MFYTMDQKVHKGEKKNQKAKPSMKADFFYMIAEMTDRTISGPRKSPMM